MTSAITVVNGKHTLVEKKLSDAEVLGRSANEPEAFTVLFDRHFGAVHRYLARRLGRDVADDLAAETFVRAFERRSKYRPETESALPWLLGIAAKLAAGRRRDERRQLRAYAREAARRQFGQHEPAEFSEALARVDSARIWPVLIEAVMNLRRHERDVMLLHAWTDLAYEELATVLDIPVGTVRSRLNRGRLKIRCAIDGIEQQDNMTVAPIGGVKHG